MSSFRLNRRTFLGSSLAAGTLPLLLGAEAASVAEEVSWLADVQRPPEKLPADATKLEPLLVDEAGGTIATLDRWQPKRDAIRRWWIDFLGQIKVDRKGPPPLTVLAEDRAEGVVRQRVRYEVEPGVSCEAYLLKPAELKGPAPGVVVLHSTVGHTIRQPAGLEGNPAKAFGLKLAQQGCVTLSPRNFLWVGESRAYDPKQVDRLHERHPGSRGMAKMLYDSRVAVDLLAAMPEVDAKRLGAVGHSLGAKEVLYLAAFDERVKVAVSSEGGVGTRFCNWHAPWYLGGEIRAEGFGHEHHELLALVAPRAFLLLGGDSADGDRSWPFIEAALPVYRLYGGTPRVGLLNHRKGHSVPPEAERRIYEWLGTYL